jgi:hypothetical protein
MGPLEEVGNKEPAPIVEYLDEEAVEVGILVYLFEWEEIVVEEDNVVAAPHPLLAVAEEHNTAVEHRRHTVAVEMMETVDLDITGAYDP